MTSKEGSHKTEGSIKAKNLIDSFEIPDDHTRVTNYIFNAHNEIDEPI